MRYLVLLLTLAFTLISNAQQSNFNTGPYYYDITIDNPDTNQANLFVTLNFFNLNLPVEEEFNRGFFPAIQIIYTPDNKRWGAELNYENSIYSDPREYYYKNRTIDLGGFYILKQHNGTVKKKFKVNSYSMYNRVVNVFLKVPLKVKTSFGIRGGYINEKAFFGLSRYKSNLLFAGLTLQRNSRTYLKTQNEWGGNNRTHDYSSWSITNLDLLYLINAEHITPDYPRPFPDPNFNPSPLPEQKPHYGFRISHQRMYSISKKGQQETATRLCAKIELGQKPLLGYYIKGTVGIQLLRVSR